MKGASAIRQSDISEMVKQLVFLSFGASVGAYNAALQRCFASAGGSWENTFGIFYFLSSFCKRE
jgi:hypothetical protein